MEDVFKKIIYTGVGAAALVIEAVQDAVEEIAGKSKETEEKGQKIVEDMKDEAGGKSKDFETKIKNTMDQLFNDLRVAKGSEMDALKDKIEELEARIAKLENGSKAAPKKAAPRKKTPPKKDDTK